MRWVWLVACLGCGSANEPPPTPDPPGKPKPEPKPPGDGKGFDTASCTPTSFTQWLGLGSQSITVKGPEGDDCVFQRKDEVEGGYSIFECRVSRSHGWIAVPTGDTPHKLPGTCKPLRHGNVFHDLDRLAIKRVPSGTDTVEAFAIEPRGGGSLVTPGDRVAVKLSIWPATATAADVVDEFEGAPTVVDREVVLELGKATLGPAIDALLLDHQHVAFRRGSTVQIVAPAAALPKLVEMSPSTGFVRARIRIEGLTEREAQLAAQTQRAKEAEADWGKWRTETRAISLSSLAGADTIGIATFDSRNPDEHMVSFIFERCHKGTGPNVQHIGGREPQQWAWVALPPALETRVTEQEGHRFLLALRRTKRRVGMGMIVDDPVAAHGILPATPELERRFAARFGAPVACPTFLDADMVPVEPALPTRKCRSVMDCPLGGDFQRH